ncbi:myosin light chain kinase 3 isoform X2 [Xenopus laevis]|uniref:Protein kinase domain-containing protein n=2 Tax=Xenopus laevis TaxID=8355 RepID=A0A974HLY9_XENLA|nr:myosin light chain kinase 3 isoform X2 [Xenopus laevis]OCT82503.1 hypothetical protein XELAEV_18025035mg [Xenopus laevis]
MSKEDSLATCLAKMYENKFEKSKSVNRSPGGVSNVEKKLNLLNEKMDKLLHFQEDVMGKLENVHHNMDMLEKGMDMLAVLRGPSQQILPENIEIIQSPGHSSCSELIRLLKSIHEDSVIHKEKLDSLERMVSTMEKVVAFVGSTLRNSKIVDFILKGTVPWKKESKDEAKDKSEEKEVKTKPGLNRGVGQAEAQKVTEDSKRSSALEDLSQKAAQSTTIKLDSTVSTQEASKYCENAQGSKTCVQKMEKEQFGVASQYNQTTTNQVIEQSTRQKDQAVTNQLTEQSTCQKNQAATNQLTEQSTRQKDHYSGTKEENHSAASINKSGSQLKLKQPSKEQVISTNTAEQLKVKKTEILTPGKDTVKQTLAFHGIDISQEVIAEDKQPSLSVKLGKVQPSCNKNTKCMKRQESGDIKSVGQQRTNDIDHAQLTEDHGKGAEEHHIGVIARKKSVDSEASFLHVIDDCPPPPAPFNHRIVSIKQAILSSCYSVSQHEVLGGGRFGQVHRCVEKATGLQLAAKIIKVKGAKDRDEVKNEINVMNQLNHVNLIQLYDAFECKNDLILIMEYLDGGELFDRITDENYSLTELDAIMFTKQICEGIYYVHQQYILHLDLKPENILCVNRTGNQIKIIDFGLARRYKPREKLKVNFGTPEFLAPEVVNYDFVSFPTDMWSVGVITYMLLSGLSPFLGESDAETMNYIVNCNWDFDSETFEQVSEEAKDFISKLLIKEKSCRLSAGQCLKHEWLVNLPIKAKKYKVSLKSQILLQKYMAQKKWKKHFYVVAAANRLKKFQAISLKPA